MALQAKRLLRQRNMTQRQLAAASGINVALINMILNGRLKPTGDQELRIATALQTNVRELFQ